MTLKEIGQKCCRSGDRHESVRSLHPPRAMTSTHRKVGQAASGRFGRGHVVDDVRWGDVEVLELIPELSTPAAERHIRACAASQRDSGLASHDGPLVPVYEVRRINDTLTLISPDRDGVRLADLLDALEAGSVTLGDAAMLDLATGVVRTVEGLHKQPGSHVHGALSPAHIVLGSDGRVALTDSVFATALQGLGWNRHRYWREYSLALPPSASLPRFDQRADVMQLGAVVLSVLLRRRLRTDESPAAMFDLVTAATSPYGGLAAGLRTWLCEALHLQSRAAFATVADAAPAYAAATETRAAAAQAAPLRTAARAVLQNESFAAR